MTRTELPPPLDDDVLPPEGLEVVKLVGEFAEYIAEMTKIDPDVIATSILTGGLALAVGRSGITPTIGWLRETAEKLEHQEH
jgi:hypothetical protein